MTTHQITSPSTFDNDMKKTNRTKQRVILQSQDHNLNANRGLCFARNTSNERNKITHILKKVKLMLTKLYMNKIL